MMHIPDLPSDQICAYNIICIYQYLEKKAWSGYTGSSLIGVGPDLFKCIIYRYIDDVLSINNPEFENYLGQMYPAELEIKDTTESTTSASYLDLLLSIGRDGQLHTSIYDKRDDFNFHITNFPFLSSNIPSSPAYGVFISQLYTIRPGLLLVWMFYSEGQATFQ